MNKIALITGSASGIGRATAAKFAKEKYDLIILDINPEHLEKIAADLIKKFKIKVLHFRCDVSCRSEVEKVISDLPESWKNIAVLVNSAGVALGREPLHSGDPNDWDKMIDINLKGMLYVFHAVIPHMLKNGIGHIINIGSITGKESYPAGGVYSVTKHAVNALSSSMRMDLVPFGIKVTVINPGRASTNLALTRYKGDEKKAAHDYEGFTPLQAEDIAEAIYFAASRPAHVNIHELVITPAAQAGANYIYKK